MQLLIDDSISPGVLIQHMEIMAERGFIDAEVPYEMRVRH